MKRNLFITGVVVAAISVTAFAANAKEQGGKMRGPQEPRITFEELDLDGDGFVTEDDLAAHAAARFAASDSNGDGVLSADELEAATLKRMQDRAAGKAGKMIERRDSNGDGVLSPDEMAPRKDRSAKMFERADTDGDGKISKTEFEAARDKMREHRKGMRKGPKSGSDEG